MALTSIIPRGLVVSCQALEDEPLHGSEHMAAMARAAQESGAVGIRANGPEDIAAIKREVGLPIIGLWKRTVPGYEVYITPTLEEATAVAEAGADIIAIDATLRPRPGNLSLRELIESLKKMNLRIMADVSTFEEGVQAAEWGVDYVSTTLCGYTDYTRHVELPDLQLAARLARSLDVPVSAEGGIHTPEQALEALKLGVKFVVVGSAITRPQWITRQYTQMMNSFHT